MGRCSRMTDRPEWRGRSTSSTPSSTPLGVNPPTPPPRRGTARPRAFRGRGLHGPSAPVSAAAGGVARRPPQPGRERRRRRRTARPRRRRGDADAWRLVVDDDGAGVAAPGRYAVGSRLGLSLCRRVAGRFGGALNLEPGPGGGTRATLALDRSRPDRKSTHLNSSHVRISYAVFCLKKKNKKIPDVPLITKKQPTSTPPQQPKQ